MTPAPARSHRRTHARSTAPRAPRRVSGPVSRRIVAAPAGSATLPRRSGTTGHLPRSARHRLRLGPLRALPEHRVVDRLLRSRAWIWVLGALLGGIVAMQVSLLKLNSGISRAVETTTTLERQNAGLEKDIARLSRTDRIQTGAASLSMVLPPAGDVGYLSTGPDDASRAVRRMQPPSEEAKNLLANGGIVPGSLADQLSTSQLATTTAPPPETATTTTPPPIADATTTPPPAATEPVAPAATPTPPVEAAQPTTTSQLSPSGGATAPQG